MRGLAAGADSPGAVGRGVAELIDADRGERFSSLRKGMHKVSKFGTYRAPATKTAFLTDLLQGTLDLLILKTLRLGEMHGLGISRRIEQITHGQRTSSWEVSSR